MKHPGLMILALGLSFSVQVAQADWTPTQRLTWSSGDSVHPAIALDYLGNLHLVWAVWTPGGDKVYYKKSTDGGVSWTAGQRLTWTTGGTVYPAIACDSSAHLHLVWSNSTSGNYEIYYKKSTDGGVSWTAGQRLTWTTGSSDDPEITVDSADNLHVVWHDDTPGSNKVYYKRSSDGGAAWTGAQRLSWTPGWSSTPAIAAGSLGNLHVVWHDSTPGNNEIYHKKSTDGGAAWATSQRLTWTPGNSISPAVAVVPPGHLHVVWGDLTPGNYEVYYKKSTDGGATWGAGQRLTWTTGTSGNLAMVVDSSGNPSLVWEDNTPGNYEIYNKKSTDGGATWAASQKITWTSGWSHFPALAVDSSGNFHVVWQDNTPVNFEVYYKKSQ